MVKELDYMDSLTNDSLAQAAYVTNGAGTNVLTDGGFENWDSASVLHNYTVSYGTLAREASTIKSGTYSAKFTRSGSGAWFYQTWDDNAGHNIDYWKGKTITVGVWIYCSTSNAAYFWVNDGISSTDSTRHSGTPGWEFKTITKTISASATECNIYFAVVTDTFAYFDGAIVVEGNAVFDGVSALDYLCAYSESTIKIQGSYALKAVAAITDSLNKTLTKIFASPLDLSGLKTIKLDMRSSRTGSNLKFGLHQSNLIPIMTSNTAPSGTASADSIFNNADVCKPWHAFDRENAADYPVWHSDINDPHWIQYQFPSAVPVDKYAITARNSADAVFHPVAWTLSGSNTGAFSGEQVVLDTQTAQDFTQAQKKLYNISNTTAYSYYRFNISLPVDYVVIGEIEMGGIIAEITPNITSADTYQTVTWDISAVTDANKDAIDSIIVTVVNADAANTIYFDNMYALNQHKRIILI